MLATKRNSFFKYTTARIWQLSGTGDKIMMEFPLYIIDSSEPSNSECFQTIINCVYNAETEILLLEIEDSQLLAHLTPDFERLQRSHDSINGVLVTAVSQRTGYDFESRYFWPWSRQYRRRCRRRHPYLPCREILEQLRKTERCCSNAPNALDCEVKCSNKMT